MLPNNEATPHRTQIIKHKPIEFVVERTAFGEINIPEPIIMPIIIEMHPGKPRVLFKPIVSLDI